MLNDWQEFLGNINSAADGERREYKANIAGDRDTGIYCSLYRIAQVPRPLVFLCYAPLCYDILRIA